MEVYELDKIIVDVVASFAIDDIDVSDEVIENIQEFYLKDKYLGYKGKNRVKNKEFFENDKRRK